MNSFKDLKNRSIQKHKKISVSNDEKQEIHLPFDREQTQIFIGYPGLALADKDDIYLRILTNYLAGQSSELFVEVRDKQGLCYATQPVHHSALQAGYWGIYIGAGKDKVPQAISAISEILEKIKQEGLPQKEIKRVQKMLVGNKALQLQTNEDYANTYSIPTLHGLGPQFEEDSFQRIQKIDAISMKKFLRKFLKQKPIIVQAGPKL